MTRRLILTILAALLTATFTSAQSNRSPDMLIYLLDGQVYAQAFYGNQRIDFGEPQNDVLLAYATAEPTPYDDYTLTTAPDNLPAAEGDFGFYQGVSDGDARYAYLEQATTSLTCRIRDGTGNILLDESAHPSDTCLHPLAWTDEGDLLLLERSMRFMLPTVRIWRFDGASVTQEAEFDMFGTLLGRTAVLPGGQSVLLGINPDEGVGYTYNMAQARVFAFQITFPNPTEPRSVFEQYPYPFQIIGVLPFDATPAFRTALNTPLPVEAPQRPAPFLHWMLSDTERRITCYPDSNWTSANFEMTCPGLVSPRMYDGHQGTDVGGIPDGLALNTPIYPTAMGVVVRRFDACAGDVEVSCGGAYGNIVMLEHAVTVAGESQTWFSGYAHLTAPLVDVGAVVNDLTQPIGLSGATGVGGAHLHFEVRNLHINGVNRWIDPWGGYYPPYDGSLWIGGNESPTAVVDGNDG